MTKVYLVESICTYEGSSIVGVFSTLLKAQKFVKGQIKLCEEYRNDLEKTDYLSNLESPVCHGDDEIIILEYELNKADHYEFLCEKIEEKSLR